jgi:DNA-binding NtrC family response regulator
VLSASSRSVQLPSPDLSASPSVYLVDDEPGVLTALARLLRSHGWAAQTYGSAEALLAALPASAIGCAVMDLAMPEMQAMLAGSSAVGDKPDGMGAAKRCWTNVQ